MITEYSTYASLAVHFETPSGLSEEWIKIFETVTSPAQVAFAYCSHDYAHELPVDGLLAWLDSLRQMMAGANWVLGFLRGRAPKSWAAGQRLVSAVNRLYGAIGRVVVSLGNGPISAVNGKPRTIEDEAKPHRDFLSSFAGFNWAPVLDDFAAAVTLECDNSIGLDQGGAGVDAADRREGSADIVVEDGTAQLDSQSSTDYGTNIPQFSSPLCSSDIAKLLGIEDKANAVEIILRRWRKKDWSIAREDEYSRRNQPRYLYYLDKVVPLLKKRYNLP